MTVISYDRSFVFVKTRKVAGTSIEGLLRTLCGPYDVVPPVTPIDEAQLQAAGHKARNFAKDPSDEDALNALIAAGDTAGAMDLLANMETVFNNHMSAVRISRLLPMEFWKSAFKFTVDRHPYSFIASAVNFKAKSYNAGTIRKMSPREFSDALQAVIDRGRLSSLRNSLMYADKNDNLLVDFVVRYEHLKEDLGHCLKKIGADPSITSSLASFKSVSRFTHKDAAEMMTQKQRDIIFDVFRSTFERFGYEK